MEELKKILAEHARRHPCMAPRDAVKLIYQNEFGPGHLIRDEQEVLRYLLAERSAVTVDTAEPALESIGNGLVRVPLAAWNEEEYPSETLIRDFIRSAALHQGNMERFMTKLDALRELCRQGMFSFSHETLEEYLVLYIAQGCPAVSHSAEYKDTYLPAYRVVRQDCLSLPPERVILKELSRRKADGPIILAIDGRCASGKTTLAARLQKELGCGVVHMDDFFLRPEQRTQERYATPGGNVDHERFLQEVLLPLSRGENAVYRPFDCSSMSFGEPTELKCGAVTVIEGSYSCHPDLFPYYHISVFLSLPPQEQMRRIILRDGEDYSKVFQEKWIPLEERYFAQRDLQSLCTFSFPLGCFDCGAGDS